MIDFAEFMKSDGTEMTGREKRLALRRMLAAVGSPTRWRILQELELGPKLNVELGERTGLSASMLSRHLRTLREAGLVTVNRAKLYSILPEAVVEPGVVDFGHFVLRLRK